MLVDAVSYLDLEPAVFAAMLESSYLVLSHGATDHFDVGVLAAWYQAAPDSRLWSSTEIAQFFTGLEVVPPGLVSTADWRPNDDPAQRLTVEQAVTVAGVARKP